ncbi:hypothetical protein QE152_g4080 [Popillia japonica]|uniref:Uncharacterized protein n=1 Tax=Popillia japonica TaxID=7064 RepID=A0AAW1N0F1_POPJA
MSKPVFLDVDPTIVERNLKLTEDNSDIDKIFNVPGDKYPSKLIKPTAVPLKTVEESSIWKKEGVEIIDPMMSN